MDNLTRKLGIAPGETTKDLKVSLETVNCLGACALAPVAVVDDAYHAKVTSNKLNNILKKFSTE